MKSALVLVALIAFAMPVPVIAEPTLRLTISLVTPPAYTYAGQRITREFLIENDSVRGYYGIVRLVVSDVGGPGNEPDGSYTFCPQPPHNVLPAGGRTGCTSVYVVSDADISAGQHKLTARATVSYGDELTASEPLTATMRLAGELLQLSTVCPAHYLQLNQQLTCTHWVTNVSGAPLGGHVFVTNDRYQGACDEQELPLPPMGRVRCTSPVYVEAWDLGSVIAVQSEAWTITQAGASYSNTTVNAIAPPVLCYLPLVGR
jgi:hypothetical protein